MEVGGACGFAHSGQALPTLHPEPCILNLNSKGACLELGSVVEVGGADGLAHGVPVATHAAQRDLLLLHDVRQLLPHLLGLAQHCTPTTLLEIATKHTVKHPRFANGTGALFAIPTG